MTQACVVLLGLGTRELHILVLFVPVKSGTIVP